MHEHKGLFASVYVHTQLHPSYFRLSTKLDRTLATLDGHYTNFATLLTDMKMDNPDPKSDKFKKLLVSHHVFETKIYRAMDIQNRLLSYIHKYVTNRTKPWKTLIFLNIKVMWLDQVYI